MITRVFGHVALKHSGIRTSILCLLSQIEMLPKAKYKHIDQQEIATILIPTHVLAEQDYTIKNDEEKLEQTNKEADDLRHQLK
jgi:hypothetical protein